MESHYLDHFIADGNTKEKKEGKERGLKKERKRGKYKSKCILCETGYFTHFLVFFFLIEQKKT